MSPELQYYCNTNWNYNQGQILNHHNFTYLASLAPFGMLMKKDKNSWIKKKKLKWWIVCCQFVNQICYALML